MLCRVIILSQIAPCRYADRHNTKHRYAGYNYAESYNAGLVFMLKSIVLIVIILTAISTGCHHEM